MVGFGVQRNPKQWSDLVVVFGGNTVMVVILIVSGLLSFPSVKHRPKMVNLKSMESGLRFIAKKKKNYHLEGTC